MDESKKKRRTERTVNPEAMFLNYPVNAAEAPAPEPDNVGAKEQEEKEKDLLSPLDNAGPMPAELLKDPYAVEIVPLVGAPPAVVPRAKFLSQERLIWISAVVVSWAVTAVAVLRALKII